MSSNKEIARVRTRMDGKVELLAPHVGIWRPAIRLGSIVQADASLGELEVLHGRHSLVAPPEAAGVVVQDPSAVRIDRAQLPVDYRTVLAVLDPSGRIGDVIRERADTLKTQVSQLAVRASSSGRFYLRPAPGKDPFVRVGDEISVGQTVALLEVMKTFNRVTYGGAGLPERARVKAIIAQEEGDVSTGDVLIEIEPA